MARKITRYPKHKKKMNWNESFILYLMLFFFWLKVISIAEWMNEFGGQLANKPNFVFVFFVQINFQFSFDAYTRYTHTQPTNIVTFNNQIKCFNLMQEKWRYGNRKIGQDNHYSIYQPNIRFLWSKNGIKKISRTIFKTSTKFTKSSIMTVQQKKTQKNK